MKGAPRRSRPGTTRRRQSLPSARELAAFLRDNPDAVGRREIARAFNLAPGDRQAVAERLRALQGSGAVRREGKRRIVAAPAAGAIVTVERTGTDEDGAPVVRPLDWPQEPAPEWRLVEPPGAPSLAIGARASARLALLDSGAFEARMIRAVAPERGRILGVYRQDRAGGRLVSAERRDRGEYRIAAPDAGAATDGELVVAEEVARGPFGPPRLRIIERLGPADDPRAVSLLAIRSHGIPSEFPAETLAEAAAARPVGLDGRIDLRGIPLVTIDGADARDFDDAVWAEPDPAVAGGWHILVAIADVGWYVRPGSALDREAERRGNSVYFPDRVVPMLPEALSNDLCSLRPGEDRACLAAHLWIDAAGRKHRHRFERGLMRSAARLTYEAVEAARDGAAALPVAGSLVADLYGAFTSLARARHNRQAIELDLPESRVVLDGEGRPAGICPVVRLDSHRLIEEFMILANVAAAEELEALRQPAMYRVHDAPAPEKVAALRDYLAELGLPGLAFARGQAPKPELFNRVLRRVADNPAAPVVNELVLRCQAQAAYSPANIGHFGLALRRYAHFTSPIRRYADLLVHRALIAGANAAGRAFGAGGLPTGDGFAEIGRHISETERRAAAAERMAIERYRAMLMTDAVGGLFAARIVGVAEFGLFVALAETGAQGLVPVSTLPGDFYDHDARRHRLVGRRSKRAFRLGDPVSVHLVEVDRVSGRMLFHLAAPPAIASRRPAGDRKRRG